MQCRKESIFGKMYESPSEVRGLLGDYYKIPKCRRWTSILLGEAEKLSTGIAAKRARLTALVHYQIRTFVVRRRATPHALSLSSLKQHMKEIGGRSPYVLRCNNEQSRSCSQIEL